MTLYATKHYNCPTCRCTEPVAAESSASPTCSTAAYIRELATNIRRNLRKTHRLLEPGNDRDSQLIDLVNHMDTLAQQIENEP